MNKTVTIGKYNISYRDNNLKKSPIVFIHGNSFSKDVFENQFNSYLNQKYRLISIDLLGHGDSSWATDGNDYSMPSQAKLLSKFVKKLGIEDALFAGHSLGGHILLEACHYLTKAVGFFIWETPPFSNLEDMGHAFLPNEAVACFFKGKITNNDALNMAKCCLRGRPKIT